MSSRPHQQEGFPHYVPFGRPNFSEEEIDAVARVMRSGWIGMGSETALFEQELSEAVGAPHVVTVNSATSALFLSLLVSGVEPGDEVICPSFTWCSTANAALYLGARPVFCDINPQTLSVEAASVRALITARTKAVVIVHFGGYAIDVDAIRRAVPSRIAIIEDAAHAFGARYPNGRPVGSSGSLTCFSFYANKNLATGEGGAVALFDKVQADRLRSLRQHGLPLDAWKRFTHPKTVLLSNQLDTLGYKMNYTDLQAAIGRVQLRRQPILSSIRLKAAQAFHSILSRLPTPPQFQDACLDESHARHLFTIQIDQTHYALSRDELLLKLRALNIGATVHYTPLHTMPLYAAYRPKQGLQKTERVAGRILTLPISATLDLDGARRVAETIVHVLTAPQQPLAIHSS